MGLEYAVSCSTLDGGDDDDTAHATHRRCNGEICIGCRQRGEIGVQGGRLMQPLEGLVQRIDAQAKTQAVLASV